MLEEKRIGWKIYQKPSVTHRGGIRLFLSYLNRTLLFVIFLSATLIPQNPILANDVQPVSRQVEIQVTIMATHWQLANWSDGYTVCNLYLKHDRWPSLSEVSKACGNDVMNAWIRTPTCQAESVNKQPKSCEGLLLKHIGQTPWVYTEQIKLPGINVELKPLNCTPGEWCDKRPLVEVTAKEPLEGHEIKNVYIRTGKNQKSYSGSGGQFNLPLTDAEGSWLIYWAESTYGDWSESIRIKYRCVISEDGRSFHFDLLGGEWDQSASSGAAIWQLFPPIDSSLPLTLKQPDSAESLYTAEAYVLLAGKLIHSGVINASDCSDGGMLLNGAASPCGIEVGIRQIVDWQNQYDEQIFQSAQHYNVPARVLKGIIAQESQFWPHSNDPYEKGLGYMTENGADLLLQWNTPYFLFVCLPEYGEAVCSVGFGTLDEMHQMMLRRKVMDKIGTDEEINVLAATLFASATQSGQLVLNIAQQEPTYSTTYLDMWKITVGNYYAGAGCISMAMEAVVNNEEKLTWDAISAELTPQCSIAKNYVERVIKTY